MKEENDREYYRLLNVSRNSTPEDIRYNYLKLSKTLHPDKQKAKHKQAAEEIFSKINHSKEVLLNPTLKYVYDKFGENGLNAISSEKEFYSFQYPVDTVKRQKVISI